MRQADFAKVGAEGKAFEVILTEAALRLPPCDLGAMRTQLRRIAELVGERRVEIGIIPLDAPLSTPLRGSFSVFDDIAVLETATGEVALTPKDGARYAELMDQLWNDACRLDDARAILTAAMNALTDP